MTKLLPILGLFISFNVFAELRATGDLAVVIEREHSSALIFNTSQHKQLAKNEQMGD
ncbi:MAG: hypothetical protein Q8Q45_01185 [Methylococcaceae bacterium]|nr:hypothetical protein [Methylococcaceae bacterium]